MEKHSVEPIFYRQFSCKAGECLHSCCKGWEIDVDPASAEYYRSLSGPLGSELRAALLETEDGASFQLTEDGRCPFLQEDGLCRLIRELGEDTLCDICALHPRFFLEVGGYELSGLGLSCEKTCELLLAQKTLGFLVDEKSVDFTELLTLLGIPAAPQMLRFTPDLPQSRCTEILDVMARTEPIDERWIKELEEIRTHLSREVPYEPDAWYDRLFQYIVYRQLDRVEEYGLPVVLEYGQISVAFLLLWDTVSPDRAEHVRRWSEQIEYSTENVDLLLGFAADRLK